MSSRLEVSNLIIYGITECPCNWLVPEEYHPFHRAYFVYSGEAFYEDDFGYIPLKINRLYLFPAYRKYRIYHNRENPLFCLWFHFNLNHPIPNNCLEVPIEEGSSFFYLMKTLDTMVSERFQVQGLVNMLNTLIMLIEQKNPLKMANDEKLDRVLPYIHSHFNLPITNSELAGILNYDARYFIRKFKKSYGQTPQEYLSNYRLYHASNYLLQGFTVAETAEKVGFMDSKAFSRFFKSHKGVSPSKFKSGYSLQP